MHHPSRNAIAKLAVLICALGATNPSLACSMRQLRPEPNLRTIVQYGPVVFIGTVVHTDGMPVLAEYPVGGKAKFKVEIPIRGELKEIFEIRNGDEADCMKVFLRGGRYFFSGTANGSGRGDGSASLPGNGRAVDKYQAEILEMFPDVQSLPSPERVVGDYVQSLSEKERAAERALLERQEKGSRVMQQLLDAQQRR